jgi:hypothetical protein
LRRIRYPKRALIWGGVLGAVPLFLMLGPGNSPIQGIGSLLNFAFFALGPLMLIPFVASGAALGVTGGAVMLWIGQGRARWVGWTMGTALVGFVAALTLFTLLPALKREASRMQAATDRDALTKAIMLADFKGTLASHQVAFPASPFLYVTEDCGTDSVQNVFGDCRTDLSNPVTVFAKPTEVTLNERKDPIRFLRISVSTIGSDYGLGDNRLTQKKIDHWCRELRPDQAGKIWCRDAPPMKFILLASDAAPKTTGSSYRDEPELAALFSDIALGSGRVECFYSAKAEETARQGADCRLSFNLADGVEVVLPVSRTKITSDDPALARTIAMIPEYWAALTSEQ